jgi:hypothetical protein
VISIKEFCIFAFTYCHVWVWNFLPRCERKRKDTYISSLFESTVPKRTFESKIRKRAERTRKHTAFCNLYIEFFTGLEIGEHGRRDPSRWPRGTLYPQKLSMISPTNGGRSVGIVRSRTQDTIFFCMLNSSVDLILPATVLALWPILLLTDARRRIFLEAKSGLLVRLSAWQPSVHEHCELVRPKTSLNRIGLHGLLQG